MKINKKIFFENYRQHFGKIKKQSVVDGINFLLSGLEDSDVGTKLPVSNLFAYILATVHHETARTYQPIREFKEGKGKPYGKLVTAPDGTFHKYYGRGYVQLTWLKNYIKMSARLKRISSLHKKRVINWLASEPDLALEPKIALDILITGMMYGDFTGKRLATYIAKRDYVGARKVVNGTDKAELIARYAVKFEACFDNAMDKAVNDLNKGHTEVHSPTLWQSIGRGFKWLYNTIIGLFRSK